MTTDQYCRLCMVEKYLVGTDSFLRNCLKDEFSIEIEDEDLLSEEICRRCQEFVLETIQFREKVGVFRYEITKIQNLLHKILKKNYVRTISDATTAINTTIEDASTIPRPFHKIDRKDALEI